MVHSYELDADDIRNIIAEKFNCSPQCVYLRQEKERVFAGCKETIKATVKTNGIVNL